MRASDDKALQYAIAEITEIATGFGLDFIRCVMKYVQRKLFIHLVHMGCRQGFHIGVLETIFQNEITIRFRT